MKSNEGEIKRVEPGGEINFKARGGRWEVVIPHTPSFSPFLKKYQGTFWYANDLKLCFRRLFNPNFECFFSVKFSTFRNEIFGLNEKFVPVSLQLPYTVEPLVSGHPRDQMSSDPTRGVRLWEVKNVVFVFNVLTLKSTLTDFEINGLFLVGYDVIIDT